MKPDPIDLIRRDIIIRALTQEDKYKQALKDKDMEAYFLAYGMYSAFEIMFNQTSKYINL